MRFFLSITAIALLGSFMIPACQQTGTVNETVYQETINSTKMAVTPHQPIWLTEEKDIHKLSPADLARVQQLLRQGTMRFVAEKYYRDENEGNRGDSSHQLFYLYGGNGQCLGARIIGTEVYMDDLEQEQAQRQELYTLLKPYLQKLFPNLR